MADWEARGLDPRIARRLVALGIEDDAALAAWLSANPEGTERLGRVMVSELRDFLENPPVLLGIDNPDPPAPVAVLGIENAAPIGLAIEGLPSG